MKRNLLSGLTVIVLLVILWFAAGGDKTSDEASPRVVGSGPENISGERVRESRRPERRQQQPQPHSATNKNSAESDSLSCFCADEEERKCTARIECSEDEIAVCRCEYGCSSYCRAPGEEE